MTDYKQIRNAYLLLIIFKGVLKNMIDKLLDIKNDQNSFDILDTFFNINFCRFTT